MIGAGGAPRPSWRAWTREQAETRITGSWWRRTRPAVGAVIIAVLVQRLGAATFVDAVRAIDPESLAMGAALAVGTTVCAAWRWRLVAERLRVEVRMPAAVASYYRSQFLNSTLPGGILGDVGRGVRHGRDVGDLGRGLRTVAWERGAGQVVLVLLTAAALLALRPFDLPGVVVAALVVAAGVGVVLVVASHTRRPSRASRLRVIAREELRALLEVRAAAGIGVASAAVVAGHLATFVVAARTVGVTSPVLELVPVGLVVLLVSAVPLNLAGWGPREGAAAWVFGVAGIGGAQGLATAVAYGTIVFVATIPGAVLLLVGRRTPTAMAAPSRPGRHPRSVCQGQGDAVEGASRV